MPNDKDFDLMATKLDLIKEQVAALKAPEKKEALPWYAVLAGVLGIPALVIAMVMNFSQYQMNSVGIGKTIQETKKAELEVEQLRSKTTELKEAVHSEDIRALKRALEDAIPLLQESAIRLEQQHTVLSTVETSFLLRFIVAWAFLHFIGVVFSVFFVGWDLIAAFPYTLGNWMRLRMRKRERFADEQLRKRHQDESHDYEQQRKEREDLYASFERRRNTFDLWMHWSVTTLRVLPRLFQVSLQVAVFVVIIIPMFDLVAVRMGSKVRFDNVLSSATQLDFSKSLSYVRDLVVPAPDSR